MTRVVSKEALIIDKESIEKEIELSYKVQNKAVTDWAYQRVIGMRQAYLWILDNWVLDGDETPVEHILKHYNCTQAECKHTGEKKENV